VTDSDKLIAAGMLDVDKEDIKLDTDEIKKATLEAGGSGIVMEEKPPAKREVKKKPKKSNYLEQSMESMIDDFDEEGNSKPKSKVLDSKSDEEQIPDQAQKKPEETQTTEITEKNYVQNGTVPSISLTEVQS